MRGPNLEGGHLLHSDDSHVCPGWVEMPPPQDHLCNKHSQCMGIFDEVGGLTPGV